MNFADIEKTWRSADNRPTAADLEQHRMKLIDELSRRRRGQRRFLILIALVLAVITLRLAWHFIAPAPGHRPSDLSQEWGVLLFFLLPWAGWFLMWRLQRRHERRHGNYEASIRSAVVAALDDNRVERWRTKIVAILLLASAAMLPLIVYQLATVGKVGREVVFPAYVIWPTYVFAMVGWLVWRDRRRLMPRQRQLEALLGEYRA